MDNVEFVEHMMSMGSPMNQIFILDALDKWSRHIIKNEAEVLETFKNTMFHGPSWVESAKHVQKMFDLREKK